MYLSHIQVNSRFYPFFFLMDLALCIVMLKQETAFPKLLRQSGTPMKNKNTGVHILLAIKSARIQRYLFTGLQKEIKMIQTDLCFYLPITGNTVDTLHVSTQRRQVKIHSVCTTKQKPSIIILLHDAFFLHQDLQNALMI